jgi:hypothetical protein
MLHLFAMAGITDSGCASNPARSSELLQNEEKSGKIKVPARKMRAYLMKIDVCSLTYWVGPNWAAYQDGVVFIWNNRHVTSYTKLNLLTRNTNIIQRLLDALISEIKR